MKKFLSVCVLSMSAVGVSEAEPAPAQLKGAVVVLDYTHAEFCTEVLDAGTSGWVGYEQARRSKNGAAEAFNTTVLGIKASRRLLPISSPGEGGIYTYTCKGGDTGDIDVNMWKAHQADAVRVVTLHFESPTSATATEGVYHGNYIGTIRNIRASIQRPGASASVPDSELSRLIAELEAQTYPTALESRYQQRLLALLRRMAAGEPATITDAEGKGSTALHCACELSHVELVQWLVNRGADVNARTASGASVHDCVCGKNAKAIRHILRKFSAGK
ncbi:MAG: ankyrin repeat domain-containing protein [Akkermansia sp.]|nr:ankyrin repeat domain-containing protein [Akkermansia sp.]